MLIDQKFLWHNFNFWCYNTLRPAKLSLLNPSYKVSIVTNFNNLIFKGDMLW